MPGPGRYQRAQRLPGMPSVAVDRIVEILVPTT